MDSRPLTKFKGGLTILYVAEEHAVNWLNSVATTAVGNSSAVGVSLDSFCDAEAGPMLLRRTLSVSCLFP